MTKAEFEKIKNYTQELKEEYKKELSSRVGALMGIVENCEDMTREEILEIMNILFK